MTVGSLNVPQTRYPTAKEQLALYRRLLDGLSQHHELQVVGLGFPGPLRGNNASGTFFIEGRPSHIPGRSTRSPTSDRCRAATLRRWGSR